MDIDLSGASSFLSSISKSAELSQDNIELLRDIQSLYDHKLWHPLTLRLLAFFSSPQTAKLRFRLFTQVVQTIATFIQPVALIKLAVLTVDTLAASEAEAFLLKLKEHKEVLSDPAAHSLLLTQLSLKLLDSKRADAIKEAVQNSKDSAKFIENTPCIDKAIFASHWLLVTNIAKEAIISASEVSVVLEKISLMSITNLLFQRSLSGGSRDVSFKEIAESANIPEDKVEFALMKLISQKLAKGFIDETTHIFKYSWVHPRSLTISNCKQLSMRFSTWLQHAETSLNELVSK
ncbi:putative regulatory subunit Rpn9 of 26S proteasome [Mitosporidium daphniae]|uniref:Putative regulatory subunit Rpn9 of 26S proteasome n=1 Tax=Mitosporidium daphniae TaxID=1485682 RepID=A0A098VQX8_9MICR|nr:putative regulatory subunit Rpn9 of 26S proteasome [Mitosporidium daphniae]KGG51433.1 putative regulatory subunit Rpn9 of 26S proteasome [Mitosporidium daphniae]|eukprot:XP_013237860.1 putative regulatory subunit Rpn9 of 26S proteasome [Mitosporidium daphniae]